MERLKKRRDFIAAAKGRRRSNRAMTVQWRCRGDDGPARYGFTVTKRTAKKAVERNRIRRRMREAVLRTIAPDEAQIHTGCDIVLIGRRAAMTIPFGDLVSTLSADLSKIPACPQTANRATGPDAQKGEMPSHAK